MMNVKFKKITQDILTLAGITINGNEPWDIQVYNDTFYEKVITSGELGMGETYMAGWWDAERVDELICRILRATLENKIKLNSSFQYKLATIQLFNLQSKRRAFIVGEKHYDLGNTLFQHMLDKRMNYSCGYWKNASNLDQAQENKLDLICRKLYLEPGMKVLDIGCGWGAFGKFAAEKYKVKVVGITVSREQVELGQELCEELPVEFRLLDYRDLSEQFDRIVSVGMMEHVGYRNYKTFFEVAAKCLANDGLFLLHTIGSIISVKSLDPWTNKYIFPNAMLPSLAQLTDSAESCFVVEDVHNFGKYYDNTLMAWYQNFKRNWDKIKENYSGQFFRMWEYYLLCCAGSFRARKNQLYQLVLSKTGVRDGYESIR